MALALFVCAVVTGIITFRTHCNDEPMGVPTSTNTLYFETTSYHFPNHPTWERDIYEFQYKGHSYFYMNSQTPVVHAAHCSCLSTNK